MAGLLKLTQAVFICKILSVVWFEGCSASVLSSSVGASVQTSSGLIIGHAGPQFPDTSEYLGIPFASPPIDKLRFAAPVAFESKQTVLANAYGPNCLSNNETFPLYPGSTPQYSRVMSGFLQQQGPQSEDCLYLNIWTKPHPSKLKPVLLWIHGGRFVITGAQCPYYDGQVLVSEHDILLVTINYRLNIFGFSGAPTLPQNVGLLDQRLAIEWVHRNIAGFGGDPDRITIFGSSAGGTSVDLYSYAWAHNPLVSGLISHSGTALSYIPNTPQQSADAFYNISASLGCGTRSEKEHQVLECMRQKSSEEIFTASSNALMLDTATIPEPIFHPVVDEMTVFSDYKKRSAEGRFARLPYLVTSNDNEAGFYRLAAYASTIAVSDFSWDQFNLAAFTCPSGQAVRDRVAHNVPAWQARYFGDWDNLRLYPGSGAYHGSDLPMVFGTAEKISMLPDSEAERKTSHYMASAWVAFASDPKNGLKKFGWPRYDPHEKTLVGLAYRNSTVEFLEPRQFEGGCTAFKEDIILGGGAI
ncbi:Carboxylesterase type B [Penicillium odoratum]|uniref:Carboxylesterase type B n=1 Tax=Penicillium odoratum TaxID=1167516 RepID=UPI002548C16D|nr:Carboxylesterase type B [Penicillium odoratum]KAJ5760300.1 Carboxylesterase type B [Penicillium odoratum]